MPRILVEKNEGLTTLDWQNHKAARESRDEHPILVYKLSDK